MQTRQRSGLAQISMISEITILIFTAALILSACATSSPLPPAAASGSGTVAYVEGVPGGIMVNTVDIQATVAAIDSANRKVTLLGPDGKKVTVKAGPEAVNFDQIKVGDIVSATVTEELVVYLDDEAGSGSDGSAGMVALAPKGSQPGGVMAETTKITAIVSSIDMERHTATLMFEDGSTKTFPVRDDINLKQHKVGEKVVFLVTEMIAVSVDKP